MADSSGPLNVVGVGASAGGVEALKSFTAELPAGLPCAILVVLHMPAAAPSVLARILDRHGTVPAVTAATGMRLEHGSMYVAAPDHHLLADDGRTLLSEGPTENGHRPAINALFRSIALSHGPRAIGVLLSGVLDDGVAGLGAIRSRGGAAIVQSPGDALFPAMPQNAVNAGVVDHQAPAAEIGCLLEKLTSREFKDTEMERDPRMELENRIAMAQRYSTDFDTEELGPPSGYICPDCNGALIAVGEGNYRCHVGHAWTADALLQARDDEVSNALWIALRSLQEKAKLSRRLAGEVPPGIVRQRYEGLAREAEHATSILGQRLAVICDRQDEGPE
ncbi:chemotaxis protein CheB [Mycobacterium sp. CSUR Q5927]|nr:chemotaxis protein CheB [Mycobacterium sp. CSUR Q5927]